MRLLNFLSRVNRGLVLKAIESSFRHLSATVLEILIRTDKKIQRNREPRALQRTAQTLTALRIAPNSLRTTQIKRTL